MNFRTKRQTRPATGVVYVPEEELPEALRQARHSYLKTVERHAASVKAAAPANIAKAPKNKREDLQLAEIHDEQEQDTAYGYLARLAHEAGFRACLCGKIERK